MVFKELVLSVGMLMAICGIEAGSKTLSRSTQINQQLLVSKFHSDLTLDFDLLFCLPFMDFFCS